MAIRFASEHDARQFSDGNGYMLWHEPRWLKSVADSYGNMSDASVVCTESGKPKFYIPCLLSRSRIFGNKAISLPFVDTGEPVGTYSKEEIGECIRFLKEKTGAGISIRFNSFHGNHEKLSRILESAGMHAAPVRDQLILHLKDKDTLWNERIDKIARTDVRKAQSSNLRIVEMESDGDVREFYSIYAKAMRSFGTPNHSLKYFLNMWKALRPGNVIGKICYRDGKPVAAIICYLFKDYVYVAYNISLPEGRAYRPNDLLYWDMISWASEKYKHFDFGEAYRNPSTPREKSLTDYKLKWGGTFYSKYEYTTEPTKRGGTGLAKRVWKKMPLFITKPVGSFLVSRIFH